MLSLLNMLNILSGIFSVNFIEAKYRHCLTCQQAFNVSSSSMEIWNISFVQLQFELSCCLNIRMKYDDEILSFRRKCV